MNDEKYYIFLLRRNSIIVYYGVVDELSNAEEQVKGYEYDSLELLADTFESATDAYRKRAEILKECIDGKTLPEHNEEYESKPLYCSFCGKVQFEVRKLIAGPSVFICDECVDLTVDIVDEDWGYLKEKALAAGGKEWFEKAIEFPPEFRQSGVGILSYFSEIVEEKYPEDDVVVRIEQEGNTVRLVVQTSTGTKEVIEKELEHYGMVVTGQQSPESLGLDAIETIKLKNELRLAQVRLESQTELLEYQRSQVNSLMIMIGEGLRIDANPNINLTISPSITSSPYQPTTIEQTAEGTKAGDITLKASITSKYLEKISALEDKYRNNISIIDVIEALKKCEANDDLRIALKRLDNTPKKGKEFLNELMQLGESVIVGAAGSGTWELLRSTMMLLGV